VPCRLPYDWLRWRVCGECEARLMSPDEALDWNCCFHCKFRCPSSANLAMRWHDLAGRALGAARPQSPTTCAGLLRCIRRGEDIGP